MDAYNDILVHIVFRHITLSIFAGCLAWRFYFPANKSKLKISLLFAFISGVLIDLDHLIDYFLVFPYFDFKLFMSAAVFSISGKNYVFFHAFEYVIILAVSTAFVKNRTVKMILSALLLGMLFHLGVDILFGVPMQAYFITHRVFNHFDLDNTNF